MLHKQINFKQSVKQSIMGLSVISLLAGSSGSVQAHVYQRYISKPAAAGGAIASPVLHYQGRLLELSGAAKPDGAYSIQFALYAAETGATAVWSETKNVQVAGGTGFFSTLLGDVTALNLSAINGQTLWLGVKVGTDSELSPRQRLASVAYALYANTAGNAELLGGQPASAFLPAAHDHFGQTWSGNGPVGISVTNASTGSNVFGVLGRMSSTTQGPWTAGVRGIHNGISGGIGVWGTQAGGGWGVYGESASGIGVLGVSTSFFGVRGESVTRDGVDGFSEGNNVAGVHGRNDNATGVGVSGYSANGTGTRGESNGGKAVYGTTSGTGFAGYFDGKVQINGSLFVNGTLSKSAGAFKIDHPLDPANQYLSHSFVESPDMMNIYNGLVTTDPTGEALVTLPDYFEALNKDFRYQLTTLGQFAQVMVAQEIAGNTFVIKTDKPNVKVSWQVTGIRKDAYAQDHPIVVEQAKPAGERGTYIYAAGQLPTQATESAASP